MTIGFDGSRAFSKDRTGTENYSYQLLQALKKIDRKNRYIVYTRKTLPWPRFWTQGGLAFQTFKDKLDVLFVPAHTLPLIRRPGLKTAVTVHDLGSEYLPKLHQVKQRLYLGLMQRFQLKGATKIIAVSKATKEDLVKKVRIDSKKIEVVYEAYDEQLFKPEKRLSRAKSRDDVLVNSLIPYFLFVGTVQPRKNLTRVIQAFSHINDNVKLVIVGSKGWLSDEIYKLPEKLGIEDERSSLSGRVQFLGYVPDEKLPALYSRAIALVFPSLFEGFGLPILEAQAMGCPVITSNISSMPEVAGKGAIFVDPYSVENIKDGMVKIMNQELRSRLMELGKENVKRFSWEKCARETLEVLESV